MMEYKTSNEINHTEKIYWFLRLLVATDKGALARNQRKINKLADILGASLNAIKYESDKDKLSILNAALRESILSTSKKNTKVFLKLSSLVDSLSKLLISENDYKSLVFCIKDILLPSTQALNVIPSNDAGDIAAVYAKAVLDTQGTKGLANILTAWDSITLEICLNKEREICSDLFRSVRKKLDSPLDFFFDEDEESPLNSDVILSALTQEFERRLGNLRKGRSGRDLEGATNFIFNYYGITCGESPSHFTASIEVDNWVKDSKGWYLGFSLKRTLRERWKQTLVDKDTLTEFKIRKIIHLICQDDDLTENKIAAMGAQRHIFFVPDSSEVLIKVGEDDVLRQYVKPMSSLIDYLKNY